MTARVVVIGAGVGGLSAAASLAQAGFDVTVIEARARTGGLASADRWDGLATDIDAGPYILLDRPGLEHAFRELGLDVDELALRRVDDLLEIAGRDAPTVRLHASAEVTADGLEATWPGAGRRWLRLVGEMSRRRERLVPLLLASRPGIATLLRAGAWPDIPFLLRPLANVVRRFGLPRAAEDLVFIWTHVAGQRPEEAPSPLAFVPALVHGPGAWLPRDGVAAVAARLERAARDAGARVVTGRAVAGIELRDGRVQGVRTEDGELVEADAVVSNAGASATFALVAPEVAVARDAGAAVDRLSLQSPGTCAYLAVRGVRTGPYLRFRLDGTPPRCRVLVLPSVLPGKASADGWHPARLIAPIAHDEASRLGPDGQQRLADALLAEPWWQGHVDDARVLGVRTPSGWGTDFRLRHDAMNPVMTARLMRRGRVPRRVPGVRGLYLAGSSTHPGQWVSFCAISGLHAARAVLEDLA